MVAGIHSRVVQMGFEKVLEITPLGKMGGLIVAWQNGVTVDVSGYCSNFVNLIVRSNPSNHEWPLSFVYGPAVWSEKSLFWYSLENCG